MKKFFMTFIAMLMISIASFATNVSVDCKVVHGLNAETIENQVEKNYHGDPIAYITFLMGENKLEFKVYDIVIRNGKTYIYGKGTNGMNLICINGNEVHLPFYGNRKLVLNNERVADELRQIIDQI